MKVWIKYLIATFFGVVAAFLLPTDNELVLGILFKLSDFAVHVGRYAVLPAVFFSIVLGIFELRKNRKLLKIALDSIAVVIVTTISLSLVALVLANFLKLTRIPIESEELVRSADLKIWQNLINIFPNSPFAAFSDGDYIFPLLVFAGFLGAAFASNEESAKSAIRVFESFSNAFSLILSFFIDFLSIFLPAIAAFWAITFRAEIARGVYTNLFILLSVSAIVLVCVIFPLILKFIFKEEHPFAVLYGSVAGNISAFLSDDINLALGVNLRHNSANFGIPRKINSVCMPVFSVFARAGSAFVAIISFVMIFKSYSSLSLSAMDLLLLFVRTVAISFFLGAIPQGGTFAMLTLLCTLYGGGFEHAYLILNPVAFFLGSIATFIDAATANFGTYVIALKEDSVTKKGLGFFI